MSKLREIQLYTSEPLGDSRSFADLCSWAGALYYRSVRSRINFDAGRVRKLVIGAVRDGHRDSVLDVPPVLQVPVVFPFASYEGSSAEDRAVMVVDFLHGAVCDVALERGWPVTPFNDGHSRLKEQGLSFNGKLAGPSREPRGTRRAVLRYSYVPAEICVTLELSTSRDMTEYCLAKVEPWTFLYAPKAKILWRKDEIVVDVRGGGVWSGGTWLIRLGQGSCDAEIQAIDELLLESYRKYEM